MIQILAVVGIIQSLQTLNGEVLLALNRSGTLLRFTILWFVCSVGAFAVGLQWGILGVATCYAVVTIVIEPIRTLPHDPRPRHPVLAIRASVLRGRAGDRGDGRACCSERGRP